jgi:PAS domain S-box-containing protein
LRLKLSHKGLILVAIPLIFELGFVATLYQMLNETEKEVQREARARAISKELNKLHSLMTQQAAGISGYGLIGTFSMAKRYQHASDLIPEVFRELKRLVAGNAEEEKKVDDLEIFLSGALKDFRSVKQMIDSGEQASARSYLNSMRSKLPMLASKFDTLAVEERKIEDLSPKLQAESREKTKQLLWAGVLLNIIIAVSLAVYFNRGTARRLNVLMDNTYRLASGMPLNPPLPGGDEIAHLDKVFNQMALALKDAAEKEHAAMETLQQSERRVRTIVETMPTGLVIINKEGTVESINPATEKMFHYDISALSGKPVQQLFPKAAASGVEDLLQMLLTKGKGHILELEAAKADGETFPVELSVNEFEAFEGARYMLVILDISERREVERIKQEFVSMVSHELRSPLTSVQGFLSMLAEDIYGGLNDQGKKSVSLAERSVTRLIKLINDLLDIDKLEAGRLRMSFKHSSMDQVVERAFDSVHNLAQIEKIELEKTGASAQLIADPDRLVQVLVNLLSNAIKYSPSKSKITVDITTTTTFTEVKVIDRGAGIPAKYHQSIFERFEQVNTPDRAQKGGSGLGLAICKAIVEQHGGQMGLTSEEGKGSTFWFKLPESPPGYDDFENDEDDGDDTDA